jgi:hypothetical protein
MEGELYQPTDLSPPPAPAVYYKQVINVAIERWRGQRRDPKTSPLARNISPDESWREGAAHETRWYRKVGLLEVLLLINGNDTMVS